MIGASDLRRRPRCQASVHRYAPAGRSVIADAGDAACRADQPCAPEPVIAEAPPAAQNWAGTRGFGPGSVTYCEVPRRCKAGSRRGIPTPRLRPWLAAGGAARPAPCRARRRSWKLFPGRPEAFKINNLAAGRTLLTNEPGQAFSARARGSLRRGAVTSGRPPSSGRAVTWPGSPCARSAILPPPQRLNAVSSGAHSGYRVSHDRGAVTVGNEAPVWPSPLTVGAQNRCDDVIGDFPV